jgi:hypothetical protein
MTSKAQDIGPVPYAMQRPKKRSLLLRKVARATRRHRHDESINFHSTVPCFPEPNLNSRVGTKAIPVHPD